MFQDDCGPGSASDFAFMMRNINLCLVELPKFWRSERKGIPGMFFLHLDCCGSELEFQTSLGGSGPGPGGPPGPLAQVWGSRVSRSLHRHDSSTWSAPG